MVVNVGPEGARARAEPGAADVRLPRHTEGARVHPGRAAAGGGARARRPRAQVCQGPEREPCGEYYWTSHYTRGAAGVRLHSLTLHSLQYNIGCIEN